jgi:hypothetical protein
MSRRARRRDAQVALRLREMKDLRTVREHGGRSLADVEPALVHLGDVGDEVGLDPPSVPHELGQAAQELVTCPPPRRGGGTAVATAGSALTVFIDRVHVGPRTRLVAARGAQAG